LDELRDFLRHWIGVILVILAFARAVLLVASDPVMGYANQGDMRGTSACVGLFPANEAVSPLVATPGAPVSLYRLGARTDGCYLSTEVAIVATTAAIARAVGLDTNRFRLQWIGFAKLAILFATALAIASALRDYPAAAVVHGLVVLLILSDPVVTLWFNTLSREFATIWAGYAAIAAACVLALSEKGAFAWGLLLVALVALAFSREHYGLLGLLLVAAAWPWLWHRSPRATVVTAVVTVAALVTSFVLLQREGVPSWPSGDLVAAAPSMVQALPSMQGVAPTHLGTLAGGRQVPIGDLPWWAYSPLAAGAPLVPAAAFAVTAIATFLMAPLALLALLVMRRYRGDPLAPLLLAILLGIVAIHAFAVTLFGGGTGEASRRYLPGALAMLSVLIALMVGLPVVVARWVVSPRESRLDLAVGIPAIAIATYACVVALQWMPAPAPAPAPVLVPAASPTPTAPAPTTVPAQ
jgi:hypothetical protein